ncbi:MAG: phosphonate C-P lyase system protein PhnH [Pseudomonadota bacterium]|nr:phosphonate C-P lyase system protein PhnH [Pseudomonadota bacterium]
MAVTGLEGGFANPTTDSARVFRHVLGVMARPGCIETVDTAAPPQPLSAAAGAVLLTLADHDTPVHLAGDADGKLVRDWIAFHTGAPITTPSQAAFAVGSWADLMPLAQYRTGTASYPDRSVTLIVEYPDLGEGGLAICGPGIETTSNLAVPDAAFFAFNAARFPLGIDMILTDGVRLAAVPRSTRLAETEA